MDKYTCPVCGNHRQARTIARSIGGQVAECATCGHLALWPQPDNESALKQYADSASVVQRDTGSARFDDQAFRTLISHDSRTGLTVLDVGCGLGGFLRKCISARHKAVGIEVTKSLVDQLTREGLDVHLKSLEEFRSSEQRYDWVTCLDVIEHMRAPLDAIEALSKLVKEGGYLVIQTPNGDAIAAFGEEAYGLHVDREHLNYFRPGQLIRLLEHHGLTFVERAYLPRSSGLGRAHISTRCAQPSNSPPPGLENIYRTEVQPRGIRALVDKLPPRFRGRLRTVAQGARYVAAFDEIFAGTAHEFLILMRRPDALTCQHPGKD